MRGPDMTGRWWCGDKAPQEASCNGNCDLLTATAPASDYRESAPTQKTHPR